MDIENSAVARDTAVKKVDNAAPRSGGGVPEEITLIDLILLLWRGKYVIAASTALVTALGIIYALFIAPVVFSSTSHFILKTGKGGAAGSLGTLAALAGVPTGGGGGNIDPSDYIDKVVLDGNFLATLFEKKWFFDGDSLALDVILEIEPDTTLDNWEYVHHMNKYETVRKGDIIKIQKDPTVATLSLMTSAPTPQLSYDLNVHTLDYISGYVRNTIQGQAKEKRIFVEERLVDAKNELERAEVALARHRERNVQSISPHVSLETARLTRQVTVNQEIYIQILRQLETVKVEELDDMTLIQILRYPEVPILRSKPSRAKIAVMAFAAGIFIGCAIVIARQTIQMIKKR